MITANDTQLADFDRGIEALKDRLAELEEYYGREIGDAHLGANYDIFRRRRQSDASWKRVCGREFANCSRDEYLESQASLRNRVAVTLRANNRSRGATVKGDLRYRN